MKRESAGWPAKVTAAVMGVLALYFPTLLFLRFSLPIYMPGRTNRLPEAFLHTLVLLAGGGLLCFLASRAIRARKTLRDRTAIGWILFLTAAVRVPCFLLLRISPASDYQMYFEMARLYAETGVYNATDYIVVVGPNLVNYILFLGTLFRIFGSTLLTVQVANTALNMVTCVFLYRLGRRFLSGWAAFGCTLAFLLSPTGILFSMVPATEHLALPFYLAGLDLAVAAFSGTGKKHRLYAAAAGVVLGYSNTIRSGALIALVSLMLCLTVKIVRAPGERRAELLKSLACVLVCFLAVQAGYSAFRTAVCAGKSAGMTYGWTLYEGLDIETAGGWRRENLDVLTEAIETLPLGQVQPYLLRKAAERVSAYSAGDWVSLFLRKGINIWIYNDYGYSMLRWMDSAVISDLTAFEPYVRLLCNFCYLSGLMAMALSMLWAATGKVRRGQAGFGIILMTLQVLIMALWHSFGTSIPRYHYYLLPLMPLTVCLCLQPVECQRAVRG